MSTASSLTRLRVEAPFILSNEQNGAHYLAFLLRIRDYLVVIGRTSYGLIIVKRIENSMYVVVPSDTVSVSSLGKRSTAEEPIKKKNPAVVKISPWTLLAECIIVKAADLDIASVIGMAFPPYRNDLAMVTKVMELTSENVYGTVSSAIMKLLNTNCVAAGSKRDLDSQLKTICSNFLVLIMSQHEEKVMKESKRNNSQSDDVGYIESEIVEPSMKVGNMLPESERLAEISQVVDYQNYKVGGNFENSNLTAKIMETRSPFTKRKDNEFVDLRPSTMSSK
ncbi:hypothetical protein BC332_30285 [Capsicum chinense]|nr:hypothetical protein BC332_30285 [Capsicum chinense]